MISGDEAPTDPRTDAAPEPRGPEVEETPQACGSQGPACGEPAPSMSTPTVIVNMPPQKGNRVLSVVLVVLLSLILIAGVLGLVSCVAVSHMVGAGLGSGTSETSMKDSVAVIHLTGTIGGSGSDKVTPETFREELKAAQDDSHVKAIVLRIDSGGGSSASSEEIASYVAECSKPVVVSVSDMCASGAYYTASQSDYIISDGGATVGSIGVILTKYDARELLDKLGISVDSITSGEDKGATEYYNTLTDAQRDALQTEVDTINAHFIDAVAQGRGMDRDEVAKLATGATWSGYQALDLGLIDEVGTYQDALDKAAELGGLGDDHAVTSFDRSSGTSFDVDLLGLLLGLLG